MIGIKRSHAKYVIAIYRMKIHPHTVE